MNYQSINETLREQGADVTAAEAHGMATGMLCVDVRADASNWLSELFGENFSEVGGNDMLSRLFEETRLFLTDDDYTFDLLLPDSEDDGLREAVEAVRDWCQGFLFGIGFSHSTSNWTGDSGEILKDIVEITKIESLTEDADSEEDEADLAEIQEYLRVAVQLIRSEMAGTVGGAAH